jgi:hypothetical protein
MKTFKTNYDQAVKEIDAWQKQNGSDQRRQHPLKTEENIFTLQWFESGSSGWSQKRDVSVNVQMFHDQGFVKITKVFFFLESNWLFTIKTKTKSKQQTTIEKIQQWRAPAEIEAEIKRKPKKFSRKVGKMEAGKKTSDSTKSGDVRKLERILNGVFTKFNRWSVKKVQRPMKSICPG